MERTRSMYDKAFEVGTNFDDFLATAEANRDLWEAFAHRARVPEDALSRVRALDGCRRLLILADDWCGDAVNTVPVIVRLAEGSKHVEARIVPRDRFPEIRDRHLTNGKRSIPVAIMIDDRGEPRGHWGPRPEVLQSLVTSELLEHSGADRYREIRRWYARDRGASTAREIAGLIERAVPSASKASRAPCRERRSTQAQ